VITKADYGIVTNRPK